MKKQQGFAGISLFLFLFFFSCVNADYHLDDISKDGAISYDNGLFIPVELILPKRSFTISSKREN